MDAECLHGGVTALLDRSEREARGTGADGRWHGCSRDGEGDGNRDRGDPGAAAEDDGAGMGAGGQGARRRLEAHRAIAGAGAGAESQPARILACGPMQGAAAGVVDAERLHGGVTALLDRSEREARGTGADGRWHGCSRDGEGDGNRDRGDPGAAAEDDGAGMGAGGQGARRRLEAHRAIAGAGAGAESQPARILACGPMQGAAAGVVDAERLHGGVTALLDRSEREARGTGADGRWHGCSRDGEGDGNRDRGDPGAAAEDDGAGMGAGGQGARRRLEAHRAIAGAGAGAESQPARILACGPMQGAAAGVVDAERLHGGVTALLDRGEREARGTGADGRWHGCSRDGEGDGNRDRGDPGAAAEDDGAGMGAGGQGARRRLEAHRAIAGAGAGAESQPARILACGPMQGAAAGVVDAERLHGGVTALLDRGEREARGTGADGRWHGCSRDGEGDGNRDRGDPGAAAEDDGAGMGAGAKVPVVAEAHRAIAGAGAGAESQPARILACGPMQGAAAGVVDAERLHGGVTALLDRSEREARGTGADGRWHGSAVTVKATGIVTGVTPVPPLRTTEPVWVPGAKVPVVAWKLTVPLPVPVPALRVNQPEFSLAVQCKVPPPVLWMLSVCTAGLLPFSIAVNARLVGLALMAGGTGAAVTVKATGIVTGVAPLGHTVTRPL